MQLKTTIIVINEGNKWDRFKVELGKFYNDAFLFLHEPLTPQCQAQRPLNNATDDAKIAAFL